MTDSDQGILTRISRLVDEEKHLRARRDEGPADRETALRLGAIEEELDQCWDLLNQRRALREFDLDPDEATVRDTDTVERYLQ